MRIVFFGSGAFGLPTLERLVREHDVPLVITQPDRPAGRRRRLTPTPIAAFASEKSLDLLKPADVNAPEVIRRVHDVHADAFVVIAFGQKLGEELIGEHFAVNLHGSLLPKYRGAAPIQRAMMAGERQTGVSVITLASRMDAGAVLGTSRTAIDPGETAGELHDRLALLGPDLVMDVLARHEAGALDPQPQDETRATRAPKLTKAEGTVTFDRPAPLVRAVIHGLTPWPGCTIEIDGRSLRLLRVKDEADDGQSLKGAAVGCTPGRTPGAVAEDGRVFCREGAIRLLSVQPPGGKAMSFSAYVNGHGLPEGAVCRGLGEGSGVT